MQATNYPSSNDRIKVPTSKTLTVQIAAIVRDKD